LAFLPDKLLVSAKIDHNAAFQEKHQFLPKIVIIKSTPGDIQIRKNILFLLFFKHLPVILAEGLPTFSLILFRKCCQCTPKNE
jgi:hypothetical protein